MKFIISQGEIKRKLEGAFWICGGRADIAALIEQLADKLRAEENFIYGWIGIRNPMPYDIPSGPPESWESREVGEDTNVTVTVQTGEDFLRKHLIPKRFREYMRDFVGRRCMP